MQEGNSSGSAVRVCMHVLGTARTDARVLREASALAKAGASVTIVDVESDPARPRREIVDGVELRHIRMPSWFVPTRFKPWFLVKAAQVLASGILALAAAPADIYHAHEDTALPACYVAARLRRRPLIFDAHELPLVEPNITRWRRLCALARAALRAMMKRCAGVITVSPPIVDELRRRYGGPPAVLVRNIPPYQPPVASKRLHETLQIDTRTRIALYQGNLQADRGLDRLVLAGRFLQPGIVIVLMGKGAMRAELEALAAREGVYDRVFILPPVPYADLLAWTASADAGLIIYPPSYSPNVLMCMPNKLFEYVMAGLPVIASPLVAVEEVLRRYGVGGVIDVPEPEQIGHAISAILSSPESLARMRQNALAACADDLRWEVEVYQLFRLYREVLGVSLASAAGRVAASGAR